MPEAITLGELLKKTWAPKELAQARRELVAHKERRLLERFYIRDIKKDWTKAEIIDGPDGWPVIHCGDGLFYSRQEDAFTYECPTWMDPIEKTVQAETKQCILCGFDLPDFHHVDQNRKNNQANNLVLLCPNHHRMVHRGRISLLPCIE